MMNLLSKPIALFFALNIVFSAYLSISVDFLSGILLFCFSICAVIIYSYNNTDKIINLKGMQISENIFKQVISLVPFNVKLIDLKDNVIVSNDRAINVYSGEILDRFDLGDSTILKAKINNKIYHFFISQSTVFNDKKVAVANLQVELVMNEILQYINKDNIKEFGAHEKVFVAFENLNDALGIYAMSSDMGACVIGSEDEAGVCRLSDDASKCFIVSPSFSRMLDFVELPQQSYLLDLFHPSERERVGTILASLKNDAILFETLMMNDSGTFPVEINANIINLDTRNLINLNIRNIALRKSQENKRDRARILKVALNENMQKIHILYLALDRISTLMNATKNAVDDISARHNELQDELGEIVRLQQNMMDGINGIIHFYSPSDIKSMVNISELVDSMKSAIFTQSILNNNSISVIQKGSTGEIYCDKGALKIVMMSVLKNSLERINYAKGSNFYGRVVIEIEELNDDNLLLGIEDNGGGMPKDGIERCFDAFYTTYAQKTGLGLTVCKIIVEDLLAGEIMAMNTKDGFRVEITLPRERI